VSLTSLAAISPIDGRYRQQVSALEAYFSEQALMHYRVWVEVEYLIFLSDKKFCTLSTSAKKALRQMVQHFSADDAAAIKAIEATTNHDVKAVEYFIKQKIEQTDSANAKEFIHFGLTSQDVNNTAIPMAWRDAIAQVYMPILTEIVTHIWQLGETWLEVPMLSRTHGQPASPTRLGKELLVFVERLRGQIHLLHLVPHAAKFGGATGNFNAHAVAYPNHNWIKLGNEFVEKRLGLQRMQFTTQIEHYDNLAAQLDAIKRINNILIDFARDIWTYISLDYFKQKTKAGEVGSSAMPHKVNPIDFENAEGNLGVANALLEHLSSKLPVSRLQRDLTDSTVLRNLGVPMAHTVLALKSIQKGLGKLVLHNNKLHDDLEANWAVVAEAIQTILRRENYPNPYEALKDLTRGKAQIDKAAIHSFIDNLAVKATLKKELKRITPHNYVGVLATMPA
jgi:adenylosuccinate lyase